MKCYNLPQKRTYQFYFYKISFLIPFQGGRRHKEGELKVISLKGTASKMGEIDPSHVKEARFTCSLNVLVIN